MIKQWKQGDSVGMLAMEVNAYFIFNWVVSEECEQ